MGTETRGRPLSRMLDEWGPAAPGGVARMLSHHVISDLLRHRNFTIPNINTYPSTPSPAITSRRQVTDSS